MKEKRPERRHNSVKAYLKEVGRLIRLEKGLKARTEGGDETKRLAQDQKQVGEQTGELGKSISDTAKQDGDSSQGDASKNEKPDGGKPGDSGSPNKSQPSPGKPSEGQSGQPGQPGQSSPSDPELQPQEPTDRAAERLNAALVANTRVAQSKRDRVAARLRPQALSQDVARRREKLAQLSARLAPAISRALDARRHGLASAARMLEGLSHKSVLARGFVMVQREDGTLVRAAKELGPGDAVELFFADDKQRAIIDPLGAEAAKPKAKPKPGGGQGSLF